MDPVTREDLEVIKSETQAGVDAVERRDYAQAHKTFEGVAELCRTIGLGSAYVHCMRSLVAQERDDLEGAFDEAVECVQLDPIHPSCVSRFSEVAARVRDRLAALGRERGDAALAERLYGRLLKAAEADAGSHVAMARVAMQQGQFARARTLLEATTLLAPASWEAWSELQALGKQTNDVALEAHAKAQRDEEGRWDAPYGVPSPDVLS